MIKKTIDAVTPDPVEMEGVERTEIRWVFGREPGSTPTFALRQFTMAPGGVIPLHGHSWEHEIVFLRGRAEVLTDEDAIEVGPGDAVYTAPDERHGYRVIGDVPLEFLCIVPNAAVGS